MSHEPRLFRISDRYKDDVLTPTPEWRTVAERLACAVCGRPHVSTSNSDPSAVVLPDRTARNRRGVLLPIHRSGWWVIHKPFATALRLGEEGFGLFPLRVGPDTIDDFVVLGMPLASRLVCVTRRMSGLSMCAGCGLFNIGIDGNADPVIWDVSVRRIGRLDTPESKPNQVFTNYNGSGLFITQSVLEGLPQSIRERVSVTECQVVHLA